MWCPVGYVTLGEISLNFRFDVDLVGSAFDRPSFSGSGFQTDKGMDEIEKIGFHVWLYYKFISEFSNDILVCPPSGIPLRLAGYYFGFSSNNIDFCDYDSFPDDYESRAALSQWKFQAIDIWDGIISNELSEFYDSLLPLVGFPLCIEIGKLPVVVPELANWLLNEAKNRSLDQTDAEKALTSNERTKGGRPNLRSEIVSAFEKNYPKGLMGSSLVSVAKRLGYDRKTVRTALIEAGHYRSDE